MKTFGIVLLVGIVLILIGYFVYELYSSLLSIQHILEAGLRTLGQSLN